MAQRLISHGRSHFVAYIALFFALTGSAVAAKPLITGADIEDGSITSADIARDFTPGAITKDNVAQDTLTGQDILESSLDPVPIATIAGRAFTAAKADDSDLLDGKDASEFLGATSKASDADLFDGRDSSDFVRGIVTRFSEIPVSTPAVYSHEVNCAAGELALGGGAELRRGSFNLGGTTPMSYSAPITVNNASGVPEARGWKGAIFNQTTATDLTLRVTVICASP